MTVHSTAHPGNDRVCDHNAICWRSHKRKIPTTPLNLVKILGIYFHFQTYKNKKKLPTCFDTYKPFLTRLPVVYNLRPHALGPHTLALPRIYHVYAESCLLYQLVKLYNDTTYDPLILRKIEEKSHSSFGFKQYVTASLLDKYSQNKICNIPDCYSCKR